MLTTGTARVELASVSVYVPSDCAVELAVEIAAGCDVSRMTRQTRGQELDAQAGTRSRDDLMAESAATSAFVTWQSPACVMAYSGIRR